MIELTETYTWKQAAVMSKFNKLQVKLEKISFTTMDYKIKDLYLLSQQAAIEGMIYFDKGLEYYWQANKEYIYIEKLSEKI